MDYITHMKSASRKVLQLARHHKVTNLSYNQGKIQEMPRSLRPRKKQCLAEVSSDTDEDEQFATAIALSLEQKQPKSNPPRAAFKIVADDGKIRGRREIAEELAKRCGGCSLLVEVFLSTSFSFGTDVRKGLQIIPDNEDDTTVTLLYAKALYDNFLSKILGKCTALSETRNGWRNHHITDAKFIPALFSGFSARNVAKQDPY